MEMNYIGEFEEGALIDGFLKFCVTQENIQHRNLDSYIGYELFVNDSNNYLLQRKVAGYIRSKVSQYELIESNTKNSGTIDTITGLGRDVLNTGGFNQWRSNEERKIKRQEDRENGMYNINKVLGFLAIVSFVFSIYQYVKNNQLETRMKGLEDTVSVIKKNHNVPMMMDSSHLKEVSPLNKIKK